MDYVTGVTVGVPIHLFNSRAPVNWSRELNWVARKCKAIDLLCKLSVGEFLGEKGGSLGDRFFAWDFCAHWGW